MAMVMPLVNEDRPKCYLCHEDFDGIESLRAHQDSAHSDYFENREKAPRQEPAPGDVSVF